MLLKGTRGLHNTEKFPFGISAFGVFWMVLYRVLSSGSFFLISLLSVILCFFFLLSCVLYCFSFLSSSFP
jgi:hypothetical protein